MKKENILIGTAVLAYSYLFYQQWPGLNCLIFSILLNILLFIKDKRLIKNRQRWVFVAGSIISGIAVAYKNSELAILANLASVTLLSVSSVAETSVLSAALHGIYSYITSWSMVYMKWQAKKKPASGESGSFVSKLMIIGIPMLVTVFFFILYRASSPVFYNYTKNINIDFTSLNCVFFTIIGWILLLGMFYPRLIPFLHTIESQLGFSIQPKTGQNLLLGTPVKIESEYLSGLTLLGMLNILVFSVNILDILYFACGVGQAGITFSDAVHQGVGALIVSIITAISIILIYLRGGLNFYKRSKTFRILAYVWISQNMLLILTTLYKNALYINEYGLTYARIGVYVYLVLAAIGLITTIIKIAKIKTIWYLASKNAWTTYLVLIIGCTWNWDTIITSYNTRWAKENNKALDIDFLSHLSNNNLGQLLEISGHLEDYIVVETSKEPFKKHLEKQVSEFKWDYEHTGWQSVNWCDYRNYRELKNMHQ